MRKEQALAARAANRTEITIANNLNTRAVMPKVMVQPGETVADILIAMPKLEQRFVNVTPDGDLCFSFLITRRLRNMYITTIGMMRSLSAIMLKMRARC